MDSPACVVAETASALAALGELLADPDPLSAITAGGVGCMCSVLARALERAAGELFDLEGEPKV